MVDDALYQVCKTNYDNVMMLYFFLKLQMRQRFIVSNTIEKSRLDHVRNPIDAHSNS